MASPSTVITLGYGSFGSANLVPTLGYGSGAVVAGVFRNGVRTIPAPPRRATQVPARPVPADRRTPANDPHVPR